MTPVQTLRRTLAAIASSSPAINARPPMNSAQDVWQMVPRGPQDAGAEVPTRTSDWFLHRGFRLPF